MSWCDGRVDCFGQPSPSSCELALTPHPGVPGKLWTLSTAADEPHDTKSGARMLARTMRFFLSLLGPSHSLLCERVLVFLDQI